MKASPTSTSTSSESMSTIVPMPVRVKPPPADSGETISPGCAALAITSRERRAHDGVVDLHLGDATPSSATHMPSAEATELGPQGVAL